MLKDSDNNLIPGSTLFNPASLLDSTQPSNFLFEQTQQELPYEDLPPLAQQLLEHSTVEPSLIARGDHVTDFHIHIQVIEGRQPVVVIHYPDGSQSSIYIKKDGPDSEHLFRGLRQLMDSIKSLLE